MKLALPVLLVAASTALAEPALTIYNQNFAVVRDTVLLDLKKGVSEIAYSNATAHIETSSVILRDPAGKAAFRVLEQNYRNDPVSQPLLLSLFEGKTIQFVVRESQKPDRVVEGKIIRSGYLPHSDFAMQRYGQEYAMSQMAMAQGQPVGQPIIEVDGKMQFGLPGQPIFPSLGDDTILKPTLTWRIDAPADAKFDGELAYITGGMSWLADYNLVLEEKGDDLSLTGWITMDNQSGRTFENAKIKLMAGDVSKLQPIAGAMPVMSRMSMSEASDGPAVTEKAFDEYHLYELGLKTTLRDRETKQVEFLNAAKIHSKAIYVYDGLWIDPQRFRGWGYQNIRANEEYGTESNTKVAVMREFKNNQENGLGLPLPKGTMRFYRRDTGGQMEFIGENEIDHTPKDETVRAFTGNAFDLTGKRVRTNFKVDNSNDWADESFAITLKNHKKEPVEIRVVEHLYRWTNWEITEKSNTYLKTDAQTIEFRIALKPDEEATVTYKVHYSW